MKSFKISIIGLLLCSIPPLITYWLILYLNLMGNIPFFFSLPFILVGFELCVYEKKKNPNLIAFCGRIIAYFVFYICTSLSGLLLLYFLSWFTQIFVVTKENKNENKIKIDNSNRENATHQNIPKILTNYDENNQIIEETEYIDKLYDKLKDDFPNPREPISEVKSKLNDKIQSNLEIKDELKSELSNSEIKCIIDMSKNIGTTIKNKDDAWNLFFYNSTNEHITELSIVPIGKRLYLDEFLQNIHKLPFLEKLTISNTNIEKLPDNFCELIRLKYLDLSNNKLNSLPDDFGNINSLEYLNLELNFVKYLPISLINLKFLKIMKIKGNSPKLKKARLNNPEIDIILKIFDKIRQNGCKIKT